MDLTNEINELKRLIAQKNTVQASCSLEKLRNHVPLSLYSKYKSLIKDILLNRNESLGAMPVVHAGLASIPSREESLKTVVSRISPQVEILHIFLNEYDDTPDWLKSYSNVLIYTSSEFGLLGDAGKFFGGITCKDRQFDYYITVDDDILYPDDYAAVLVAKSISLGCPVGVHGSLLKDGNLGYYSHANRYVFHFADSLAVDQRVHILGTGTTCLPSYALAGMANAFYYPNMADVWVAKYFAQLEIPLAVISRKYKWLQALSADDSIWSANNSSQTTQSVIVDSEIRELLPKSKSLKLSGRPKVLIGVKTYNRHAYLQKCLESVLATVEFDSFDISLLICDGGSSDETISFLDSLRLPVEITIIKSKRAYAAEQFNIMLEYFQSANADFLFCVDDDVVFIARGWISAYYSAAINTGYSHLCHFNRSHYLQLASKNPNIYKINPIVCGMLESNSSAFNCMGALFTLDKDVIDRVGYADTVNFFVRGKWHVDYSARCCRAGFNEIARFFDISNSSQYIALQNTMLGDGEYSSSIDWDSEEFKSCSSSSEVLRRIALCEDPTRIYVSKLMPSSQRHVASIDDIARHRLSYVRGMFGNSVVINLDRRKDRWRKIQQRMSALGIDANRYSAFDGMSQDLQESYAEYKARFYDTIRLLDRKHRDQDFCTTQFYTQGMSEMLRAYAYHKIHGKLPMQSPGALAYLKSYQNILRTFASSTQRYIAIFDDDCMFHYDFFDVAASALQRLPSGWKACLLGAMQYNWDVTSSYSDNLYNPNGAIVGSHATLYSRDGAIAMLGLIEQSLLPLDVGPLSALSQKYKSDVFVILPNLAIQAQADSDISNSDAAKVSRNENEKIFGWCRSDYF